MYLDVWINHLLLPLLLVFPDQVLATHYEEMDFDGMVHHPVNIVVVAPHVEGLKHIST